MRKKNKGFITNPETIEELKRIQAKHGGILMPEDIIACARQQDSPLHRYFQWNDTEAAHMWRIEQAKRLLRITVEIIEHDGNKIPTRVFCSLSDDRADEGGYRTVVDVLSNPKLRKTLLADAVRDIHFFTDRYEKLREVYPVILSMKKTLKKIG